MSTSAEPETLRTAFNRSADGWRGWGGERFESAVHGLSRAIGEELLDRYGARRVLVAHDCREDSAAGARAAAAGLSAAGMQPLAAGPLPTPVANFALAPLEAVAALIVTASHNRAGANGVKLKIAPGRPPDADFEAAVEGRRDKVDTAGWPTADYDAEPVMARDLVHLFRAWIGRLVARDSHAPGLKVVVDGLHGVAGSLLATVLRDAGCEVWLAGGDLDPTFGGLEPNPMSALSRRRLVDLVRRLQADLGLAVDADGDRLGVVDANGTFRWPHDVAAAILEAQVVIAPDQGGVAHTVATGSILERTAADLGLSTHETAVGFKHIAPLLMDGRAFAGAGGVGDIGFAAAGCDRNPFHGALLAIATVERASRPLAALVDDLYRLHGASFYAEVDLPLANPLEPAALEGVAIEVARGAGLSHAIGEARHLDGVKLEIGQGGWLLLRSATTERRMRVCVDARDPRDLARLMDSVRESSRRD